MLRVLVGAPGAGKSTAAAGWGLLPGELVRADEIRGLLTGSERRRIGEDQATERHVWAVIEHTLRARLLMGLPTVLDSAGGAGVRHLALRVAARTGTPVQFVVFDVPVEVCVARNAGRERVVPEVVVRAKAAEAREVLAGGWRPPPGSWWEAVWRRLARRWLEPADVSMVVLREPTTNP